MSDTDAESEEPKKKSKLTLMLGLVLALVGGGGGFYAAYFGLLPMGRGADESASVEPASPVGDISFVPLETMVISLGPKTGNKHLKFAAQLEVSSAEEAAVTKLKPRVLDVLNGYLRAVEFSDLENPSALIKLRSQMLRRVQIVTGDGRVRDLLITEFVLN